MDMFSSNDTERAIGLEYNGEDAPDVFHLKGDGDFRSAECIDLLKQADIVVTNPPFSLFRKYVVQLMDYAKKFLIIGNMNAVTYRETFSFIKDGKMWLGQTTKDRDMLFDVPEDYAQELIATKIEGSSYKIVNGVVKGRINAVWYTNLDYPQRQKDLILSKKYSPEEYPTYDNYDAIEVGRTAKIPVDYDGEMGVPISFLKKYNPEQFDILGLDRIFTRKQSRFYVNGKAKYARIVIRHKVQG